jgi:hypothetical protein
MQCRTVTEGSEAQSLQATLQDIRASLLSKVALILIFQSKLDAISAGLK